MAYSNVEDIQAEFKNADFAAATAIVKSADVSQWIQEIDSLIDSYVGIRYVVPVSTGDAATLLRMFSRLLVAERVRKKLEVKQGTNKDAEQNPRGALSTKDIMAQLQRIADGAISLAGLDPISTSGGFSSYNRSHCVKPEFKKDVKSW